MLFYSTVHCKAYLHSFTLVQTRSTRARVAPLTEHSKFCCFVVVCLVVKVIHIR